MVYKHTIELLEDALYGAGTAAAGHGDIELVLVVIGHVDMIGWVLGSEEVLLLEYSSICGGSGMPEKCANEVRHGQEGKSSRCRYTIDGMRRGETR